MGAPLRKAEVYLPVGSVPPAALPSFGMYLMPVLLHACQ